MRRVAVALALCVCLSNIARAWIEETGTLRGLVLGHCAGCAYDNWTSHVVEGLADPGYNDYGPAWFDPQMNGFGHFTYLAPNDTAADRVLSQWRSVFAAATNGQWTQVDSALASHVTTWRYDLVRLQDTELNRTFFVLRERLDSSFVDHNVDTVATDDVVGSFDNGWGLYVFNTTPLFPKLGIQVVHPQDDFLAIPTAMELFIRTNARVLMLAGAGREVLWDTTQHNYSNGNALSDPSRNERTPYEKCHEALFDALDGGPTAPYVTVQMHSYDHDLHPYDADVQLSAFGDSHPNPPLRDRAFHGDLIHYMGHFPVQGIPQLPSLTRRIDQYAELLCSPAYAYTAGGDTLPIRNSLSLPGASGNQQAVYSHRNHNIDRDPENFVHVEVNEYPNALWTPTNWHNWLPGNMPASSETYIPALAYYESFIAAMDTALRVAFLCPDTLAPTAVHLDTVRHAGADSIVLRWSPVALDRMFDSYILYYDTVEISGTSYSITRQTTGYSGLWDFTQQSAVIRGLPRAASRYRFAVGSRDIFGNIAIKSNSAGLSGGTVAFVLPDAYMGCAEACHDDTLYLTFDQSGYQSGRTYVVLPAALEAAWPAGTGEQTVYPAVNAAAHLSSVTAKRIGTSTSDTLRVSIAWSSPYSAGDNSRYIAAIPIHNQSASATQTLTITTRDTTTFTNASGPQLNQFAVGPATVFVDCAAPTSAFAFHSTPTCPFGSAPTLEGKFDVTVLRGAIPSNAPLASAYIDVNGNSAQRVMVFNALQTWDYVSSTFPDSARAAQLWSYLPEGCSNMTLHAFDSECNERVSQTLTVVKDLTAPSLSVTNSDSNFCYNNISGSSHFGGTTLDERLDISTALNGGACTAGTGGLTISYGTRSYPTIVFPPDLSSYPSSDSSGAALWAWIVSIVPSAANGERYSFTLRADDCAGNSRTLVFSLVIDLSSPANAFTQFDARPTDMGVWLNWSWHYDASQAVGMEIWRSGYFEDYPLYSVNRWADLADTANYPRSYPPSGFVKVVEQNGLSGTTSSSCTQLNRQLHLIHGGPDSAYWMDEDSLWRDDSERRDIYRYITYVKDAAGNASVVSAYGLHVNADRSTNYWLGDFSRDALTDPNGSSGLVNTTDLALFSACYFIPVPQAPAYFDIGPENAENGYGKGIPTPDGQVDFADLVPFSMNFGTTGSNSFATPRRVRQLNDHLNEPTLVRVLRSDSIPIDVGDEFGVIVSLSGNGSADVKALEMHLCYDDDAVELLSTEMDSLNVKDGLPFTAYRRVPGDCHTMGIAAAAIGPEGHLDGQCTLARLRFHWKNRHVASTGIALQNTKAIDMDGLPFDMVYEGIELTALHAIPVNYALYQNFPNPFNPSTRIRFDLPEDGLVRLDVFNCLGQHAVTLIDEYRAGGTYTAIWDGKNDHGTIMAAGVYFYRVHAGSFVDAKKMVLLK